MNKGKPVKVVFHGGSVTSGARATSICYQQDNVVTKPCHYSIFSNTIFYEPMRAIGVKTMRDDDFEMNSFANLLSNWINGTWPHSRHQFIVHRLEMKIEIPSAIDLCIIDISINSDDFDHDLEQFIRACLLNKDVTIVAFHWLRHLEVSHQSHSGEPLHNYEKYWMNLGNMQMKISHVYEYYGVTSLSYRGFIAPLVKSKSKLLYAPDLAHPDDLGHAFITSSIIQLFAASVMVETAEAKVMAMAMNSHHLNSSHDNNGQQQHHYHQLYQQYEHLFSYSLAKSIDPFQPLYKIYRDFVHPALYGFGYSRYYNASDLYSKMLYNNTGGWIYMDQEIALTGRSRMPSLYVNRSEERIMLGPFFLQVEQISIHYMVSYQLFGDVSVVIVCSVNQSQVQKNFVLHGWHSDHTSLPTRQHLTINATGALCNVSITSKIGGNAKATRFKVLAIEM